LSRVQNFTAHNPSGNPAVVIARLECIKIPQAVYILDEASELALGGA
jgi:hypothetical protein